MSGVIICAGCGEPIDPENEPMFEYIVGGKTKHVHARPDEIYPTSHNQLDCLIEAVGAQIITPEEIRLQKVAALCEH